MKKHTIGVINSALAAISYGTNPLFALPMFGFGLGVNSVLFYRYFFAVIIYFFWLKFFKKVSLKITKEQGFFLFILSAFFSLSSLLLFMAFKYMPSGLACTILFIYPVLVALISFIFFKEKITLQTLLAITFTILGIFQLYSGEISFNFKGIFLVLMSGLCYALYMVFVRQIKSVKTMKSEILSFYVMLFGLSVYIFNLKFCINLEPLPNFLSFLCALGLAVIPTIISLETITIGIKLIGSTKTAVLGALEPITALFFGIMVFGEVLTFKIFIGIILIFIGVNMIILKKSK